MAPPIYFLPHLTRDELAPGEQLNREVLARFGLDAALADCDDVRRDCAMFELSGASPGGLPGCLLMAVPVDGSLPHRVGYYPIEKGGRQQWQQMVAGEKPVWVGTDPDQPPTPADLVRRKTVEGYRLDLAGGRWIVPVIRDPLGHSGLPARWTYQGDQVVEKIRDEYQALWDDHAEIAAKFYEPTGPPGIEMDRTAATEACLRVLAVNYRVGRIEQDLLGLVDSETWLTILGASVDLPLFGELFAEVQEKKKRLAESVTPPSASESTATSPGSPDSCPGTDPAAENSPPPHEAGASPSIRPPTTT